MANMKLLSNLYLYSSQMLFGPPNVSNSAGPALGIPRSCPVDTPLSCSARSSAFTQDSCCLNYPGGQFAQTQFWNSNKYRGPPGYLGPEKSWTIHGLWPDHCDGNYDSVCDCKRSGDCSSRNAKCKNAACNKDYSNITAIMERFQQTELLIYMNQYWKGIEGDENLHQHEWSKHGTCINTLEPTCYDDYVPSQEVVDYFRVAVDVFKSLPTYQWLLDADITPSLDRTYSRAAVLAALKRARGVSAVIGCQGAELREVWYLIQVRGSLQSGQFVASEPDFSGTGGRAGVSCPESGIKYLPKQV